MTPKGIRNVQRVAIPLPGFLAHPFDLAELLNRDFRPRLVVLEVFKPDPAVIPFNQAQRDADQDEENSRPYPHQNDLQNQTGKQARQYQDFPRPVRKTFRKVEPNAVPLLRSRKSQAL